VSLFNYIPFNVQALKKRAIDELIGHKDIKKGMIYTLVPKEEEEVLQAPDSI
jgi:site-specific recombinase XerD